MTIRPDAFGLWWEDQPDTIVRAKAGPRIRGPRPAIPETGWTAPTEFPNLSAAKAIGVDTETFDPELLTAGPGWSRNSGHLIGVSIAVDAQSKWYFPIRHETNPENNMDPEKVLRFIRDLLGDNRPKIGANLIYDLGWLIEEGVPVGGRLYDIQFAEALLNSETPDVSLDGLAAKYLGVGKTTSELYQWLADWCGGKPNDKQRKYLYLSPPELAGPYAEDDAALPLQILERQWPLMAERGVLDIFDLECRLIPLLVAMRRRGAPVDVDKAAEVYENMATPLSNLEVAMHELAGQEVNPNAGDSIRSAFDKVGLEIPTRLDKKTGEIKVSFSAPLLETIDHPLPRAILDHRRTAKIRNTFIKGYILDKHVDGFIHCSFHPLRGDAGGARSGRFSSSLPNLQNIPVRTELGKMVRGIFTPKHKSGVWRKWDYSQIEYRLLAHHAVGEGASELRREFNENPETDYHQHIIELILKHTGINLKRRPAKTINFGLIYGMSKAAMIRDLKLGQKEGNSLFTNYHTAAPFARATMDAAASEVHRTGMVETIGGRKSDFTQWGPKRYQAGAVSLSYGAACRKWGIYNIERSHTHKALNRKLQGGAADIMKRAMVAAYEGGFFDDSACGMPCLTVHDELDFEDYGDPKAPIWNEFKHLMENVAPELKIPIRIDGSIGDSWGTAD